MQQAAHCPLRDSHVLVARKAPEEEWVSVRTEVSVWEQGKRREIMLGNNGRQKEAGGKLDTSHAPRLSGGKKGCVLEQ